MDIGLESLDGCIASSVVNGNTELTSLTDSPSGALDLGWGETLTGANADIVTLSWTTNSWTEKTTSWAWGDGSGLINYDYLHKSKE